MRQCALCCRCFSAVDSADCNLIKMTVVQYAVAAVNPVVHRSEFLIATQPPVIWLADETKYRVNNFKWMRNVRVAWPQHRARQHGAKGCCVIRYSAHNIRAWRSECNVRYYIRCAIHSKYCWYEQINYNHALYVCELSACSHVCECFLLLCSWSLWCAVARADVAYFMLFAPNRANI